MIYCHIHIEKKIWRNRYETGNRDVLSRRRDYENLLLPLWDNSYISDFFLIRYFCCMFEHFLTKHCGESGHYFYNLKKHNINIKISR